MEAEFDFLRRLRARPGFEALGDDAAVLAVAAGESVVATVDVLVEGVHFRPDWSSPADIGWKAAVVNVSDIAAMGAEPRWLLVGLGLPTETPPGVVDELYEGLREACDAYGCRIVGGDTVAAAVLTLAVTALGTVEGEPLVRSAARVGDVLAVTGPLGAAGAGVRVLQADGAGSPEEDECVAAHRRPRARVDAGRALRASGCVTAAMDLSDGLLSDLRRLAEASRVGLEVEAARVPVSEAAARTAATRGWDPLELALGGGEDFELLVAARPDRPLPSGLHPIGRVVDEGLWLVREEREPLPSGGWDHFAPRR